MTKNLFAPRALAGGVVSLLALFALAGCTSPEADKNAPPPAPYGEPAPPSTPAPAMPAVGRPNLPPVAAPGGEVAAQPAPTIDTAPSGPMSGGGGGGPMSGGPMGGMTPPMAPLTPTPGLDGKIAQAEKSGDKKAIGAAYAIRGRFRNDDSAAGARVKYRAALSDFRKSLAADPANADALQGKGKIEAIYTQMGRPIPSD